MQKIILLLGIMILSYCSFGGNPPAAVQKAFDKQFPKASNIKWGKENAHEYEADFVLNGAKMSANFVADGTWLETETEIQAAVLPVKVTEYITKAYPGWVIAAASKVEEAQKGLTYEVKLKSGAKKKEVSLTPEGTAVE